MTYYHKKSSPLPWIAALVLLGGFVVLVVMFSGDDDPQPAPQPVSEWRPSEPEPVRFEPTPEETAGLPAPPEIETKPQLTAAQAEKKLRAATLEWRAFAVQHCRNQNWKSPRAVAFLEKTTWNDRDLEKQHANGLVSLRIMLGSDSFDPVELATALDEKGDLTAFFERNWSKLDAAPEAAMETETVLEDQWKPNRIRWGFPLDTPIADLQEFKRVGLATGKQVWQALVGRYIQGLEIDDETKMTTFREAIGQGFLEQEAKMLAAYRVLLGRSDASLREVVGEIAPQAKELAESPPESIQQKMAPALEAAQAATGSKKSE